MDGLIMVALAAALIFASVCVTRKDPVVQSAGLLIGVLSLITLLLLIKGVQ